MTKNIKHPRISDYQIPEYIQQHMNLFFRAAGIVDDGEWQPRVLSIIKKGYRRLVRMYHPDTNPSLDTAEKRENFIYLTNCYNKILDVIDTGIFAKPVKSKYQH